MTKKRTSTKKKAAKAKKESRKPEFEKALDEIPLKEKTTEPDERIRQSGTRPGGISPRPGAEEGPAPPDDNLGKIDRQISKAPKALAPVLKIPFSIWASVSQIEEMKLSDTEAEEWAMPIIDLLDYYFPGKIPEIIWIWLMFLSATEKVVDSRVKIRYEKRQERKRSGSAPGSAAREPASHTTGPAPKHNGAEPAEDYPTDG